MHIEPEPFEQVGKLLALKKFEKPPPRYFEDFSGHVIARIEAEDALRAMPWWERLTAAFDLRPAFVGVSAVLLSAGVVIATAMLGSDRTTEMAAQRSPSVSITQPGMAVVSANLSIIDRAEEIPASTTPVAGTTLASTPFSAQPVTFRTIAY